MQAAIRVQDRLTFRTAYWALVPALAVLAYVTALRIGFVSDDFVLLFEAKMHGAPPTPVPYAIFYRPLGLFLTWVAGWYLWGFNPLPYHIISLLAHAGVALLLGLWLAESSSNRVLGWLAGALFAVFPLNIEAVGWVSAQWDTLAALFGLASLWLFTRWWLHRGGQLSYLASLALFTMGIFTKESLLTWLPVYGLVAWFVAARLDVGLLRRLGLSLLPFCVPLLVNVFLRFVTWGRLGGYPFSTDYGTFFWDALIERAHMLLAPINTLVLGKEAQQTAGALSSLLLLLGLVLYGRKQWRLLMVAGGWLAVTLVPVLSYPVNVATLENSRFFYLASGGYCVGVAALLYAALTLVRHRGRAMLLVGLTLLVSVAVCWIQLRPWHNASVLAAEVAPELRRLIPPQTRPNGMVWYVENNPDSYRGAPVLMLGLDRLRYFTDGEILQFKKEQSIAPINPATDKHGRDVFTMRFQYSPEENRYHVEYLAGMTADGPPPTSSEAEAGAGLTMWDFRDCSREGLDSWRVENAEERCERGKGRRVNTTGPDPQLVGPEMELSTRQGSARFVRLRVSARYAPGSQSEQPVFQWFWRGPGEGWSERHSRTVPVKQDGERHVYWTFVPVAEVGDRLHQLRFDLAGDTGEAEVAWIALDLVK